MDTRVEVTDGCGRLLGLGLVAEGDQVERAQRANESAPEVTVIPGVLGNAAGHERMGDLEQYCGAAA